MNESASSASAGIRRFDEIARTWDDTPRHTALARAVAGAILHAIPLAGTEHALEFGCGTGLVTGLIAPNVADVLAVDNSSGMLATLMKKLDALHLQNVSTRSADISHEMPRGPFDLVYSSMTLHHIGDVADTITRLYGSIAPGGWVALADLAPEDGSFHGPNVPGVMHHGFQPADLLDWLARAGFRNAQVPVIHHLRKQGADGVERSYDIQLALAQKPKA